MKVGLAGAGDIGSKHLEGIKIIDRVGVVALVGGRLEATADVAQKYGISHVTTELDEAMAQPGVEAAA